MGRGKNRKRERRQHKQKPKNIQQKRQHQQTANKKWQGRGTVGVADINATAKEIFGGRYYCPGKEDDASPHSE